jgi:transcriptional regulator with PAS, ATPase and Fis domain
VLLFWRLNAAHTHRALIGQHPLIQRIQTLIRKVAVTDATVLISGESGTGKELVARQIHTLSPRANGPFIPLNCGAIPAELLESELFGHERGAFTGAVGARHGMFQVASGGTILLDEVAEMSPPLQVKLLRVLQEREFRPVGSDKSLKTDVRVIAASNKELFEEVSKGRFREDLFYRLQVIPIRVPPLRDRRSDIPLLIDHFLEKMNARRPQAPVRIGDEARVQLWEYDWPGNVRELENVIEQLVILADEESIEVANLPPSIRRFVVGKHNPTPVLSDEGFDFNRAVEAFENQLIVEALRRSGGNKQAAARLLGLKRTTLVAKLRRRRGSDTVESVAQ